MNCAFTSLSGFLFNCPSLIFYNAVLYNIVKFHVLSHDFFSSKFCKFSLFMKVLKIGIFGLFFSRVQNALSCNIFNQIVTGRDAYSYLPKMNLFLWTALFPVGFESSLETLNVIFLNVSPKGFFKLFMKNFEISVLTGILDHRQPLLINSYPAIYNWLQNINQCNKGVVRLPIVTIGG